MILYLYNIYYNTLDILFIKSDSIYFLFMYNISCINKF